MTLKHKDKYLQTLQKNIAEKLKEVLQDSFDNPVVKARNSWNLTSEMLFVILGHEVHEQWFAQVNPLVLKNNVLILQTHSNFAAQWINTHYQELVESLLITQDPNLSCFFIAPRNQVK
tara:strand:+ start:305 stop:658 length:354 start_codon:yes stop_codon:yes gene_type:complete